MYISRTSTAARPAPRSRAGRARHQHRRLAQVLAHCPIRCPSVKVWPSLGPLSNYGPPRAARQILRATRAPTDHPCVGPTARGAREGSAGDRGSSHWPTAAPGRGGAPGFIATSRRYLSGRDLASPPVLLYVHGDHRTKTDASPAPALHHAHSIAYPLQCAVERTPRIAIRSLLRPRANSGAHCTLAHTRIHPYRCLYLAAPAFAMCAIPPTDSRYK